MLCLVSGQVHQHAKSTWPVLLEHVSKLDWCCCSCTNGYASENMCIKFIHTPSLPGVFCDTSANLMCVTVHHKCLVLNGYSSSYVVVEVYQCHVALSL
jgi:hypothetical protein